MVNCTIFIVSNLVLIISHNCVIGELVPKFTTVVDERQTSSSKQAQELTGKVTSEQVSAKCSEAVPDIDAAKVAAMKAAELGIL